jgi:hypothetical protein
LPDRTSALRVDCARLSSMDMGRVRAHSLATAKRLGYPHNDHLPLLEEPAELRAPSEVADRCLALTVVVARAYGWPTEQAIAWLDRERLATSLTNSEQTLVGGDPSPSLISRARESVESLWVLAWALGIGPALRFDQRCPDNLVELLPNLKRGDDVSVFRSRAPRSAAEIVEASDLAYLLHWAVVDASRQGRPIPGRVGRYVIENRRRALDWILMSDERWEDIPLDT